MEQKEIQLIKRQESFKLIVTKDLEKKIRYLCDKLPNNEYSGTLFYKINGSFKDKNIEITAVDFYIQDIGTVGFTEFNNDASLACYMVENNLLDCYQGLLHSHNTMPTFFSGTDTKTLKDEGIETNHFVSLIVNNAGNYSAAITRKLNINTKGEAIIKYNTFNNEEVTLENKRIDAYKTIIEYFNLDIIVNHPEKNSLQERIEFLRNNSNSSINTSKQNYNKINNILIDSEEPKKLYNPEYHKPSLFKDTKEITSFNNTQQSNDKINKDIDNKILYHFYYIITGNIFQKSNVFYPNIAYNYKSRFPKIEVFKDYVENIVEFMRQEIIDIVSYEYDEEDIEYTIMYWSTELIKKLQNYNNNEYIEYFIKILSY